MITFDEFKNLVLELLGDNLADNPSQRDAISYDGNDILTLVAGPGSGKTRVLVLRALRHVLVDDILPENIVITTFTRKAAKELRTRWLNWGSSLLGTLGNRDNGLRDYIEGNIDINRCRIDTLDSIAQQTLTENKLPGEIAPILLEQSASKLILKRQSFGNIYRANQGTLGVLLGRYTFDGNPPPNQGTALNVARNLCDRLIQDRVHIPEFERADPANELMVRILTNYQDFLRQANLYDFAFLEQVLLERLQRRTLDNWCNEIQVLLIDEYQDTNPLQEEIYFQIISIANPKVVVVGDDDQSMYRFRGSSVELFTQFGERCRIRTGRQSRRIDMVINYRSSEEIVHFYNTHIRGDPNFASARILPAKPDVISNRGRREMPVLGLFRPNPQVLANDLANLLNNLIVNREIILGDNAVRYEISLSDNGDWGDFVLLSHSIQEITYDRYDQAAQIRFPGFLRIALEASGRHIFNPRGRALRTIPNVQILLGLLLLCLDPDGRHSVDVLPTNEAQFFLNVWRNAAQEFVRQNPRPSNRGGISGFIGAWQSVSKGVDNHNFPADWPVLELIFTLISWIPSFQSDPEHQVWLEAITRVVASAGMASPYGMQIYKLDGHRDRSRQSFIRDALLPIAENEVDVDEDIMPSVPRNYIQLMTIHQAKGLEFPLVIVDVGSHFTGNWSKQRFLRFPDAPSNVARMEDDVEQFLDSPLRSARAPLDRTFDDIVRLYYVAFSRPQSVLLLIGCENCLRYGREGSLLHGAIPNVALGWNRDGTWPWRQRYLGGRRPIRVDPPLLLV
jgi:DNA helicase-2/ATP-dependent DNA helicase PcrA